MKLTNIFILFTFILLVSCAGNVGKILRNEKIKSTDEFLVKKKDPLILPPDFSKLPVPKNEKDKTDSLDDFDLEKILNKSSSDIKKTSKIDNSQKSLEKSIIEKINKN